MGFLIWKQNNKNMAIYLSGARLAGETGYYSMISGVHPEWRNALTFNFWFALGEQHDRDLLKNTDIKQVNALLGCKL